MISKVGKNSTAIKYKIIILKTQKSKIQFAETKPFFRKVDSVIF